MKRLPILDWDILGMAISTHEQPTAVASQLFQIMESLEYTADDIRTVARTLLSCVDSAGACAAIEGK
jgi:hypothetical protein